jgi:hypothetical protein
MGKLVRFFFTENGTDPGNFGEIQVILASFDPLLLKRDNRPVNRRARVRPYSTAKARA